jgi:hypothetical protein
MELVDPLSTDEAYESIGADMLDHDRRPFRANLLPHVLMNTRRCAQGFRGRAKPSMMMFAELQRLLKTWLIKY